MQAWFTLGYFPFITFQQIAFNLVDATSRKTPRYNIFPQYPAFCSYFPQLIGGRIALTVSCYRSVNRRRNLSIQSASFSSAGVSIFAIGSPRRCSNWRDTARSDIGPVFFGGHFRAGLP